MEWDKGLCNNGINIIWQDEYLNITRGFDEREILNYFLGGTYSLIELRKDVFIHKKIWR